MGRKKDAYREWLASPLSLSIVVLFTALFVLVLAAWVGCDCDG